MLRSVLGALALVVVGGPAWAGCSNYTDGSLKAEPPEVVICYKGLCGQTTLKVECANSQNGLKIYANGWRLDWDTETGKREASFDGLPMPDFDAVKVWGIDE